MKEVRKLKGLQSQLKIAEGESEALKIEFVNKQREYTAKKQHVQSLKDQIKALESDKTVKVSEHAIIRYLERVRGLDVKEVEKEILTDEVVKLIETLGGSGAYPLGEHQLKLKDYTVITVL